jgi:A/G-specific adenine glycosylase
MRPVKLLKLSPAEKKKFQRQLLSWFAERKRDLPWRRTRDPYRIWISEIMLQQTRVAAVIPYYEKFIGRFATVESLARAKTETVLKYWSGLGYYSRARNMHRAAKQMVSRHARQFPRDHQDAIALPGIGRYTAAAVLSIAYGEPLAVLDGNVARVLARIGAIRTNLRAPGTWQSLETAAQDLLAQDSPGDWNQAVMELGATVCTPKSPRCEQCPVASSCRAYKLAIANELPVTHPKRDAVEVILAATVFLDCEGQTIVMRKQGPGGALFSNLWQFPAIEVSAHESAGAAQLITKSFGLRQMHSAQALDTVRHSVTFRKVTILPYLIRLARLPEIASSRAIALNRISSLPISNLTRKIAATAVRHICDSPAAHSAK